MLKNKKFSEQNIRKIIYSLIRELKSEEYLLSKEKKDFLDLKLFDFLLYFIDDTSNIKQMTLKDEKGNFYSFDMPNTNLQSMVLEHPPCIIQKEVIKIYPTIVLKKFWNEDVFFSTTYHEICHFLSIGDWQIEQNKDMYVQHVSGIVENLYLYNDKGVSNVKCNAVDFLNEYLNDWIAMKLYEKIEEKQYKKIYNNKEVDQFIRHSIRKNLKGREACFIGLYFSNNVKEIEHILINGSNFRSLDELNKYFQKKEKEKNVLEKE